MQTDTMNPLKRQTALYGLSNETLQEALKDVFVHLGYRLDMLTPEAKEDVAQRLSQIAGKEKPWGWRYVHNFLSGAIEPGRDFRAAIIGLAAASDGTPLQLVQSHPVMVSALGSVRPGALIYGDSRPCANPGCPVHFLPRVSNQTHCGKACAKAHAQWKREKTRADKAELARKAKKGLVLP
jgi:hypothetical protein